VGGVCGSEARIVAEDYGGVCNFALLNMEFTWALIRNILKERQSFAQF